MSDRDVEPAAVSVGSGVSAGATVSPGATEPGAEPSANGGAGGSRPDRRAAREGSADPERGLDLLWRGLEPTRRGPRHKLTLEQLAVAGMELADAEGLDAVSIRRVAAALGVGPMSLYTYVPSKVELLELMIDQVFAEIGASDPSVGWRQQVEFLADQRWQMYRRHPWVLTANLSRIPLSPNVLDAVEGLYAALRPLDLSAVEVISTVGLIESYLQGSARTEAIEAQEVAKTGVTYEEYWGARESFWVKYFDPARYPEHTRLWEAGGFDQAVEGYTFGLTRILDAVALSAAG